MSDSDKDEPKAKTREDNTNDEFVKLMLGTAAGFIAAHFAKKFYDSARDAQFNRKTSDTD